MTRRKKVETGQVLLRLPVSLIERIDNAVLRFKRHSRNQVTSEIVETYFDFWERLEQQKAALLAQQYDVLMQVPDETGKAISSTQQRKK